MPKLVADLHIHSHYSRATSQDLTLEHLYKWAQLKGVHLVGAGDIAHPGWLQEIRERLEPAEEGLFQLKAEYAHPIQQSLPAACHAPVRFLLAGEVSNIYKKAGEVRKIHHLLFMPSLAAVEWLQARLERIGNIRSDGRPILGLDSRDLLEIVLETDPQAHLIPAHIWTPWFAILGSKSGFDSIEACFDDLTSHIFALETGLSSDPPMNWTVSALDRYTLVSNSDAHSPQKLAREATLFQIELSYPALFAALQSGDPAACLGTLEFFPEEGKYHYDGHRSCAIRWGPSETQAHGGVCPVCGKEVTIGVMNRVAALADRKPGERPPRVHAYTNLIPLPEILAEVYQVGPGAKQVQQQYDTLLSKLGAELTILQETPLDAIERVGGPLLAEGIRRIRQGQVRIAAGYDGEYGVIQLFEEDERQALTPQLALFGAETKHKSTRKRAAREEQAPAEWVQDDLLALAATEPVVPPESAETITASPPAPNMDLLAGLNPEQRAAATATSTHLLIVAGPGTGKTRTLTHRMAHLIASQGVSPRQLLAITFTNKAAEEMANRLITLMGPVLTEQIMVKTFHAFGAWLLQQAGNRIGIAAPFAIVGEEDRQALLKTLYPDWNERRINQLLEHISAAKNQLLTPEADSLAQFVPDEPEFATAYRQYQAALHRSQAVDFDDLLLDSVRLLETDKTTLAQLHERFRWISVDEYQDINLAQARLLRLLTAGGANLCAIGDPDQAIYGFRGADRRYFLSFAQDFPGAELLRLNQNYRSTQLILNAASQVIARSPGVERLKLWSEFVEEVKLDIHPAATDKAEAEYVVHQIEQMVGGTSLYSLDSGRVGSTATAKRAFGDFAVLYRLNTQSQPLVEALERSGIPFQTAGERPLNEYKEIREVLAYLWLLHTPNSLVYWGTLLNTDKALFPAQTINELGHLYKGQSASSWAVADQHQQWTFLNASQTRRLTQVVEVLRRLHTTRETAPVAHLIEQLQEWLAHNHSRPLDEQQQERLQQLIRRAIPFGQELGRFLEVQTLQRDSDFYDLRADRVTLMTLHAAKGLEFPVVFITGCEDGLLPYVAAGKTTDIEEERRIFYVGMTRAQQKLVLTRAKRRLLFGQFQELPPARFLNDIEQTLIELKEMWQPKMLKEQPVHKQLSLF
jgi:uncharacterized protein (TIGR00375 family)